MVARMNCIKSSQKSNGTIWRKQMLSIYGYSIWCLYFAYVINPAFPKSILSLPGLRLPHQRRPASTGVSRVTFRLLARQLRFDVTVAFLQVVSPCLHMSWMSPLGRGIPCERTYYLKSFPLFRVTVSSDHIIYGRSIGFNK